MNSYAGGIQITSKPGADFYTLYGNPDTNMYNMTLAYNPTYSQQVRFEGKNTDNIPQHSKNDLFRETGLKKNPEKQGWVG